MDDRTSLPIERTNDATIAVACAALPACASWPGATSNADAAAVLKAANEHIETCERHYQGGLGAGATLTFRIDCPAQPARPAS